MRCMVCGEEMRLVQTVPDETMLVPGFEHHILACPSCNDEERRLVFTRQTEPFSPSIEADQTDSVVATLQPVAETAAADSAPPETSSVKSEEKLSVERLPLEPPLYQSATSSKLRGAISRVWDQKAALHQVRWRALCDRLGLRVDRAKADTAKDE
jgi:hypothetical protein